MIKPPLGKEKDQTLPTNNKTLTTESQDQKEDSYNMLLLLKNNLPKLSSMKKKFQNTLISQLNKLNGVKKNKLIMTTKPPPETKKVEFQEHSLIISNLE